MTRLLRLMSERIEPNGTRWTDCAWCSGMIAADFAGWVEKMPRGWTVEERELLERSCDQAPETGAGGDDLDQAMSRRWGVQLAKVPSLPAAMRGPATTALVLMGNWHLVPLRLRHWSPTFGSADPSWHAVCFQPSGDGLTGTLVNPLAPEDAPPAEYRERVTVAEILPFAMTRPGDARIATEPKARTWTAHIRRLSFFHLYTATASGLVMSKRRTFTTTGWTIAAGPPVRGLEGGKPVTLHQITTPGKFAGLWLNAGAYAVSVSED